MKTEINSRLPLLFTRKGAIKTQEDLLHANVTRQDSVEVRNEEGAVVQRFAVLWLELASGELVPTVASLDLLPVLADFLEAREAGNAYEY